MMVRARCLQRCQIPAGVLTSPSPASFNSNRLAVHAFDNRSCCVFFASGTNIYQAKLELNGEGILQGKDSLVIPADFQMAEVNQLKFSPHRSEIQSISISEPICDGSVLLGTVDSFGRIVVSCVGLMDKSILSGSTFSACPRDAGVGEGGWAGLAFVPSQPSLVLTDSNFSRSGQEH